MTETNSEKHERPLICCICYKICRHKQVLPCCLSVTCKSCLKEWIEKQDVCPHCGARFRKQKPEKKTCKTHQKPLNYYCKTCNQYLCSDCLLEQIQSPNSQHSNHEIVEASNHQNETKTKKNIKQEENVPLEDLKNHLESLKKYSKFLDEQLEKLLNMKNHIPNRKFNIMYYSNANFKNLRDEIENLYTKKQQDYKQISDSLEEQLFNLQSVLEESELILTTNDPKIVPSAQANIDKIKQINNEFIPIDLKPPSLDFPNKLCPDSQSFTVTIPDFKKILFNIQNSIAENDYFLSEVTKLFKFSWCAKIFPNGTQNGKGTHLAVYVELLKGDQTPTSFVYQIEIKPTNEKSPIITRKYTSFFQPNDSWGWNKIVTIDSLTKNYLDKDGALSLTISISPSSYEFCIKQKKDKYDKISKQFKKLKKDIENLNKSKKKDFEFDDNENSTPTEM